MLSMLLAISNHEPTWPAVFGESIGAAALGDTPVAEELEFDIVGFVSSSELLLPKSSPPTYYPSVFDF